ncbi:putative mitochondrial protein, partial [Mucuna pruriens]
VRSNHGREFENHPVEEFYEKHGIGRLSKKNLAKIKLNEIPLQNNIWVDAFNIDCYVFNKGFIRRVLKKTSYDFYKGTKLNISHFNIFSCNCFILKNGKNNLNKFDTKVDEGIFFGYLNSSTANSFYNKVTMVIEVSIHVSFNESDPLKEENKELNQFERNKVWKLLHRPTNNHIVGSKWVFKNKLDETRVVTRNKERLMAKGYN